MNMYINTNWAKILAPRALNKAAQALRGQLNTISTGAYTTSFDETIIKPWAKISCHKCSKELGYVKDGIFDNNSYYCDDCRLLEKLKE